MFYTFCNIQVRREFGGSAFIEFQYCKLKSNIKLKKIVSVRTINNWKDDSLYIYVDDINVFLENYGSILNCGTYNNMKTGLVDVFGINYYTSENMKQLIDVISSRKPLDYENLVSWIKEGLQYNGFYLLGI